MSIGLVIGLLTTIVSGVMAVTLLNRYRLRGGIHQLLWGLGLVLYFISGLSEVVLAFGWSDIAFRMWYWSGALLVPPVLGQGTMHLLVRKGSLAAIFTIIIGVVAVASLVWIFSVPLDATKFLPGNDIGKFLTGSYRDILPESMVRRVLPPIMNGYGTLLLAGGAVYSAWLFLRKQILPNRVLGNVFIAAGGLLPAAGGALIKLAETIPSLSNSASIFKYVGILGGVVLLFIGFQLAVSGAPAPASATAPQGKTATAN
jgi:hypothetical protein